MVGRAWCPLMNRHRVADHRRMSSLLAAPPVLTEEDVLCLLDVRQERWKGDREGWVTLEHGGIAWRVHYRHGEILEVGWWTLLQPSWPRA